MSGIGRSVKGRGGGGGASRGSGRGATRGGSQAGGVCSSSGRIYFASNPSTSNLRDSVSALENSPPSETLRQSPAVSASSPTRDGSSSPTEQHPHQTQNPHPPPPQNLMTLDDLLGIPGRENHLPALLSQDVQSNIAPASSEPYGITTIRGTKAATSSQA
ncbi:hypothetical protein YC2023_077470 [Brassica napus]